MRTWRLDLDSDDHAPRLARHSVRSWIDFVDCDDDKKIDIVLLVSEFVTQAVNTGAAQVSISVIFDDGRLRIDVRAEHPVAEGQVGGVDANEDTILRSFADRMADAATDTWGRRRQSHQTHTWAEILC
jgi:hypothetical protein